MKRFVLVAVVLFLVVGSVIPARAFDVKLEDAYVSEKYLSRYVNCTGFVQSNASGLVSDLGTNIRLKDAGFLSGVYNLDFWNFSAFRGNWPDSEGNNEVDLTLTRLGDFDIAGKKILYQIGAAYVDLGNVFNGFKGDYAETILDFLVPLYAKGAFNVSVHLRDEAFFPLGGSEGSAGTFNYGGLYQKYGWGKFTLSLLTDVVYDDGRITGDWATMFLLRPSIAYTIIDTPRNRLDLEVSTRTTMVMAGGDQRDGTETSFYTGATWYPKFINSK